MQVTDLSSVVHDVSPSVLGSGDALRLSLEHLVADDFTFSLEDYDGTKRLWLERGCVVEIFIDTFKPPTTRRLYGMVEEVKETWPLPATIVVEVTGRDVFSIYLDRKVMETYLNTEVSAVVRDLMRKYIPYSADTVLAMSLYEGSGIVAHDESKYGNDGTIYGWLAGWKKRILLTIDRSKVGADLTDFPILVHLSAASGIGGVDTTCVFDEIGANNLKIAVTAAGAECYVEVEKWDAAAREAWIWVKVPAVHTAYSDVLSLYYGSDHADNSTKVGVIGSAVAENVWEASAVMVQHMRDATTSTILDSTGYDNDGAKKAANEPVETASGKIDSAQEFDGTDDVITIVDSVSLVACNSYSLLSWVKRDATQADDVGQVISKGWYFRINVRKSGLIRVNYYNGASWQIIESNSPIPDGIFSHIVGLVIENGADSVMEIYINGALDKSEAHTGHPAPTVSSLAIGAYNTSTERFKGIIDEPRIYNVAQSAEWIKADYNSGADTLLTFGGEAGDYGPWVDGKYGKALSFDGVDDYVDCGTAPDVDYITILAWIKPHTIDLHYIISSARDMSPIAGGYQLFLTGTTITADIWRDSDQTKISATAGAATLDAWQLVGFTFDGTTLTAYKNGLAGIPVTMTPDTIMPPAYPLRIGTHSMSAPIYVFDGVIDEVRIYSRALSATEVKAHYDHAYLHDIDVTAETPDDLRFPYRGLREVLDYLASISGFDYRGNPNTVITWKAAKTEDSGVVYDQTDLSSGAEKLSSLYPIKNRVYVLGGYYYEVDQEQLVHAAAVNTKDYWYAQSFIPTKADLDQISLYLKRTLNPANLEVEIRTDNSGPYQKVATLTIDAAFVDTAAGWIPAQLDAALLIGVKYWIVLQKVGDVANYYEWSHDNLAAGENAYSSDGSAWTVQTSSYKMAYKTYYKVPVLAVKQDYASAGDYMWRELVHRDEAIVTREAARATAQALLDEQVDETPSVRSLKTANQTVIPDRGKLVTVTLAPLGITAVQYEVQKVSFNFPGGQDGVVFMDVGLGRSAEELGEWLNRLRLDIDRTKIGSFGVDVGLVNLVEGVADAATALDAVVVTELASGSFKIEAANIAKIAFSDVA